MELISWMLQNARSLDALKTEEGQTFAEYGLIFALVVIIAMAGLLGLGPAILAQFVAVTAQL